MRTLHESDDELGRLGLAFNSMAEDMSRLYHNLEDRVAEKTADLERSNRSLELLYHSISRIYDAPIAPHTYVTLLTDLEQVLGIGQGATCLIENDSSKAVVLASTLNAKELLSLVQSLPPGYRIVFNLYVFEGYKHREIAEALGISEGTSKSNLSDARLFLQKALSIKKKLVHYN